MVIVFSLFPPTNPILRIFENMGNGKVALQEKSDTTVEGEGGRSDSRQTCPGEKKREGAGAEPIRKFAALLS